MSGFIGDNFAFEKDHSINMWHNLLKNPRAIFTGVDPISIKMWNKILGRNDKPIVDQMGGATNDDYQHAKDRGIDTHAGHDMQNIAHVVAAIYAGKGIAGSGMWGGSSAGAGAGGGSAAAPSSGGGNAAGGIAGDDGGGSTGNWFTNFMSKPAGKSGSNYGQLIGSMMKSSTQDQNGNQVQYDNSIHTNNNSPYTSTNYQQYNPYQPSYFDPNSFNKG